MSRQKQNIDSRFYKHVKKSSSCWEWTACKTKSGYGKFSTSVRGKWLLAHRVSLEIDKQVKLESNMFVLHKCDNRSCVNPNHLFLGNQKDNIKDCVNKKRNSFGEKQGSSKLNNTSVREIINLYGEVPSAMIAGIYGVTQSHVCQLANRTRWKFN